MEVKDERIVFLCREVIREEVCEGIWAFFLKLCCEFDSSKVNFTRLEVRKGHIGIDLVWK